MKPGYNGNFTILESVTTEVGGERKATVRNITRDQIAILQRSKALSTQEAEAGKRLQLLREQASVGGLKAQEYGRTFQDSDVVKGKDSHIPEQVRWAFWKLKTIRRHMSPRNWELVTLVAWENLSRDRIAARYPRYGVRCIGARIGEAFEELANVIDRG